MERVVPASWLLASAHLMVALALLGCAPPPGTAPPGDGAAAELAALEAATGVRWQLRPHVDVGTPAFLEGRLERAITDRSEAVRAAQTFLGAHRRLFGLAGAPPDLGAHLGAERMDVDELGMTHVRLGERLGGVRVRGGELVVHFDARGALVRIHGRYLPLAPIVAVPALARTEAKERAIAQVSVLHPGLAAAAFVAREPQLVIDPEPVGAAAPDEEWRAEGLAGSPPGTPRLAWLVDLTVDDAAAPERRLVFVDAATGQPYRSEEALDELTGWGQGALGTLEPLQVSARDGRYWLENEHGGTPPQRTYTAGGGGRLPGQLVSSERIDRWDAVGPAAGAAVDAHAHVARVTAYFATVHGRAGALGDGAGMRATVHFGQGLARAFWNGRQLVFGDGDDARWAPPAAALDVVAHEFTHAVVEQAAGLGRLGQHGALGEALADIFACFVEEAERGARADWRIGEDIDRAAPPLGLRDLGDPGRLGQPSHLEEALRTPRDRRGAHANATIAGHAAYLMVHGGIHTRSGVAVAGLGTAAARRIWYRALAYYLGPSAVFRDAADATMAAARDLYGAGSPEEESVRAAWRAVGVLPPGATW